MNAPIVDEQHPKKQPSIEYTRRDAYFMLKSAISLIQNQSPSLEDLEMALDLTDRAQEKIGKYRDEREAALENEVGHE